jgi:hypothetical protein
VSEQEVDEGDVDGLVRRVGDLATKVSECEEPAIVSGAFPAEALVTPSWGAIKVVKRCQGDGAQT